MTLIDLYCPPMTNGLKEPRVRHEVFNRYKGEKPLIDYEESERRKKQRQENKKKWMTEERRAAKNEAQRRRYKARKLAKGIDF